MAVKVLHVVASLSPNQGGTTTAVLGMASSQSNIGVSVTLASTQSTGELGNQIVDASFDIQTFSCGTSKRWRYSKSLTNFLTDRISTFDVVHIHGLWQYPTYIASRCAFNNRIPIIVSPHGMLNDWAVRHRRLRKTIYFRCLEKKTFKIANCVHAITKAEGEMIASWVTKKNLVVIPNGIDLTQIEKIRKPKQSIKTLTKKVILYLGRIHPIKGIERLIEAVADSKLDHDWHVIVAGPHEVPEYLQKLESLVRDYHLEDQVTFHGPVYGSEKWNLLERSWVTVVPSYSEVIGMVNLESAAIGTPTITSLQTGLDRWQEGGGLLFESNNATASLPTILRKACAWSFDERIMRGNQSMDYVAQNYDLGVIAKQWLSLYTNLSKRNVN